MKVPEDLDWGLDVQHGGFLRKDGLGRVAQVDDLAGPQNEGPVRGGLPRVGPQELLQDPLVHALEGHAPVEDRGGQPKLLQAPRANPPALVLELVDAQLPHQAAKRALRLRVRRDDHRAVVEPHVSRRGAPPAPPWRIPGWHSAAPAAVRGRRILQIGLALVQALEVLGDPAPVDLHGGCGLRLGGLDQRCGPRRIVTAETRQPQVPRLRVGIREFWLGLVRVIRHEHIVEQESAPQPSVHEDD
mmetsp:Transcript_2278/g.7652  ORF Transcript_2278/g.7652 Transcript_2278/m.7652 type:complete len:244 (+) Transcript_2278:1027-1758(+)